MKRSELLGAHFTKSTWDSILSQARRHPIQIRDTYQIVMSKDESYYINQWMKVAGSKNLNIEMPKILKSNFLSNKTKSELLYQWKMITPNDYKNYMENLVK